MMVPQAGEAPSPEGRDEHDAGEAQPGAKDSEAPNVAPRSPTDDRHGNEHAVPHARRRERLVRFVELLMTVALEALPVTTWMLVLAGINHALGAVPLPFWWIMLVLLVGWAAGAALRLVPHTDDAEGSGTGVWAIKLGVAVGWLLSAAISLILSPAAYFGIPPHAWLATVAHDLNAESDRLGAAFLLVLLVAYLWWRGVLLGRLPLNRDRIYIRFLWGLAATVLAIAGAAAVQGTARPVVAAALSVLLPAEVFVGLVGIALGQLLDAEEERRRRRHHARRTAPDAAPDDEQQRGEQDANAATITQPWLLTALGISGCIVGGALVLALIVSYDSVRGLAALLQPLAAAVSNLIEWLIEALAFVLFLLLDKPITWIKDHVHPSNSKQLITPPQPNRPGAAHATHPLPHEWLVAGRWVLVALVVALVIVVLMLALRRFREWRQPHDYEEDREGMDAAAALGRQLHTLLAGLRRRQPERSIEDALPEGSVRRLYREMLAQAALAGYGRRPGETPDEYGRRLAELARAGAAQMTSPPGLPDFDHAVELLTIAYDPARYRADESDAAASQDVVSAHQAALAWLAARAELRVSGGSSASSRSSPTTRTTQAEAGAGRRRLDPRSWLSRQK